MGKKIVSGRMAASASNLQKIDLLKSIDLFETLSVENLDRLAKDGEVVSLSPGEVLFREGDPGDSMFVILSGEISIEKENTHIAKRGPGEYFGEMTLIESSARSATAKSAGESRLLKIFETHFQDYVASNTHALRSVIKTISERARENLKAFGQGVKKLKSQDKLISSLQVLLNDASNEIYVLDASSFQFLKMNSSALKNLGYESQEIVKMKLFDILGNIDPDDFGEWIEPLRAQQKREIVLNGIHKRKDGSHYPVRVSLKLHPAEGHPVLIGMAQDISHLKKMEDDIKSLTFYDSLTGLPNKNLILENLDSALQKVRRENESVAVFLVDLDDFKTINDSLGHQAGDWVIQAVSKRLKEWSPPNCCIGRYRGDEFIVVVSDIHFETEAAAMARGLLKTFQDAFSIRGQKIYVTLSIGISYSALDGFDGEALIKKADTAMHFAKANGKNTYSHFNSKMALQAQNKLILECDLRKALEQNEFVLYYQPKMELKSETLIGFEALVRWEHPEKGLVPPAEFIPAIEKNKLIIPLGEWVLRTACQQMRKWLALGFPLSDVAVNISTHQFNRQDLAAKVMEIISETGIFPECLTLEITESVLMANSRNAISKLQQLNAIGVKLSLDDFGTGFSSLSYLNSFPLSSLKIDRTFVKNVSSSEDAIIAKSIVSLAKALNLTTIVEGVETEKQKEIMRSIGCDIIQGYLLSKPLPVKEATQMLSSFFESDGVNAR
ncbi:MAG: EAL domain-containing protein [Nitrospinaceae bacterium]